MRHSLTLFLLLSVIFSSSGKQPLHPKHEFRGAWISTAFQDRYTRMTPEEMRTYFIDVLNRLCASSFNAIVFQARPSADAFYRSSLEPVSRFWTGQQGKAPTDDWDPMSFLIDECHARGMEFHAWLNPYRVTTSAKEVLTPDHLYFKHPQLFVSYDNKIYFNPGIPENRSYICKIIQDILDRYNVDAIHMDDYFYPYPIAGKEFPDQSTFIQYGAQQGFSTPESKADWRRNNVNQLVREIKETIVASKPWVRFGISPFGIYANKKTLPNGSNTNGLENYSDLYADVLLWTQKSWIDYVAPQLYWEVGFQRADYKVLLDWWANNRNLEHLYIGESVIRTINARDNSTNQPTQIHLKQKMIRANTDVDGQIFWNAYDLIDGSSKMLDTLATTYFASTALPPPYKHMGGKHPSKVTNIKIEKTENGNLLTWNGKAEKGEGNSPVYFVVYRFNRNRFNDIEDPRNIYAVTTLQSISIPASKDPQYFIVTALNNYNLESKPSKQVIDRKRKFLFFTY